MTKGKKGSKLHKVPHHDDYAQLVAVRYGGYAGDEGIVATKHWPQGQLPTVADLCAFASDDRNTYTTAQDLLDLAEQGYLDLLLYAGECYAPQPCDTLEWLRAIARGT